jgi:hypothetical protein
MISRYLMTTCTAVGLMMGGLAVAAEKGPDTQEYSISQASRSANIAGSIDGSMTFNRQAGVAYDGTCAAASSPSGVGVGVGYQVYTIVSPSGQDLDAEVALGTLGDSYLFLYCDPFDPLLPATNLVAGNDDGGVGLGSAITPADGVALAAGVPYQLVVTTFSPGDTGTYNLILGGDIVMYNPTIPTLNGMGLAVLGLLLTAVSFLSARRRRHQA